MMLTNNNILSFIRLVLLVAPTGIEALAATRVGDDAVGEVLFHVSQFGDDDADGLTPESSFRTLERARDQIRTIHRGEPGRRCRVKIAPGRHSRRMPFILTDEDSDTVYESAGDFKPVISGTWVLENGVEDHDAQGLRVWRFDVPGAAEGKVWFNQLWVNGRRAAVARWPKAQKDWKYATKRTDFLHPSDVSQTVATNAVTKAVTVCQRLFANPGDLDVLKGIDARDIKDVSLVVCHNWDVTRRIVLDFDAEKGLIETRGAPFNHWNPWQKKSIYYLENVPGACTEPGDWFFESRSGRLVYRPLPREELGSARVEIPRTGLTHLVEMTGSARIAFRGIVFEGTDVMRDRKSMTRGNLMEALGGAAWDAPGPVQYDPIQAAAYAGAMVCGDRLDGVAFERCVFRHTGDYALWLRNRCKDCRVERCHVYDTGAGGLRMGDSDKKNPSRGLLVRNCLVEDCGLVNPCGVGLWIGEPQYSRFLHNHIRRTRYSGISMGWNWTYDGVGVGNELAFNLVEDVGLGGLTDEAAVYLLGRQDGTTIHDNVLRRIDGYTFCRWALYFDQGTTGVTAYNNLCYDAIDGGFVFHYGRDNVVSNNIFATGRANHMVNVGKAEPFKMLEFTRNIVWWDANDEYWDVRDKTVAYRDYGRDRKPGTMLFSSNIWWCANGEVKFRAGTFTDKGKQIDGLLSFDEWRKAPFQAPDNDDGSVVADPQFADPHGGDFSIRNKALVDRIGFRPWDWRKAGIEDEKKDAAPTVVQPFLAQTGGRPPCVVNGDNDHYFKAWCMRDFVTLDERVSSEAGARKYIDAIAAGGRVTHLFACAVGQRADYDAKACDPIWLAIDEAKARGEEPDEWPLNAKRMHDAGFDCFKVWCEYGRSKGISVWISQRMNDVHGVEKPWNIRTNRFWYEHPELHRCPEHDRLKDGGKYNNLHALDYSKPAVQEFEFGIFKELVDRYDAEGFELDFMRFWENLTPGKEREQAPILTAFIKRCRDYANSVAVRRGHPILLSARIPSSYAAAVAFGFDPVEWARQGLVDMIAVANFWIAADYDFDFPGWKARIAEANPAVTVLPSVCPGLSCGERAPCTADLPAVRGWADNALAAGADGLYIFNAAYMSTAAQRALYGDGFSAEAIRAAERRHLPSFHDCTPKGGDTGAQLPVLCKTGGDVEIVVGHADGRPAEVVVALNADVDAPPITLNGAKPCGPAVRENGLSNPWWRPKAAWRIPFAAGAAADGRNVVSIAPVKGVPWCITWCEIFLKGK